VAGARTGPTQHTSFVNSPPSFPKRPLGYFREIPGPPVGRRLDPRDLEVPAAGPGATPQLITSRGVQSLAVGGLAGQGPPAAAAAGQPLAPVGQNPPPRAHGLLRQQRGMSKARGAWNRKFLEKYDLQKHNIF